MAYALRLAKESSDELLRKINQKRSGSVILASLESASMAVVRASNPEIGEIERIKEESLQNLKSDGEKIQFLKEMKEILRKPKKANLVFLGGKTLGGYLKENLSTEEQATLFKKIGTSKAGAEEFLQDKEIPKNKEVDKKLLDYLKEKSGLNFVDYVMYKGNTKKKNNG